MRSSPMDAEGLKGAGEWKRRGIRTLLAVPSHLDASNCAGDREMLSETVVIA